MLTWRGYDKRSPNDFDFSSLSLFPFLSVIAVSLTYFECSTYFVGQNMWHQLFNPTQGNWLLLTLRLKRIEKSEHVPELINLGLKSTIDVHYFSQVKFLT